MDLFVKVDAKPSKGALLHTTPRYSLVEPFEQLDVTATARSVIPEWYYRESGMKKKLKTLDYRFRGTYNVSNTIRFLSRIAPSKRQGRFISTFLFVISTTGRNL